MCSILIFQGNLTELGNWSNAIDEQATSCYYTSLLTFFVN